MLRPLHRNSRLRRLHTRDAVQRVLAEGFDGRACRRSDSELGHHRSFATDSDATKLAILDEDARYFLHQSLSSPCINVLEAAEGIHIQDRQG